MSILGPSTRSKTVYKGDLVTPCDCLPDSASDPNGLLTLVTMCSGMISHKDLIGCDGINHTKHFYEKVIERIPLKERLALASRTFIHEFNRRLHFVQYGNDVDSRDDYDEYW